MKNKCDTRLVCVIIKSDTDFISIRIKNGNGFEWTSIKRALYVEGRRIKSRVTLVLYVL